MPASAAERSKTRARWLKLFGMGRFTATKLLLLAAVALAALSWRIPILVEAERALFDIRTTLTAPRVDQDARIAIVTFTESTLERTARRSPVDRGLLARALANLDALHPKSVGVDILMDQRVLGEDEALTAAIRAMHTPVHLAFATARDTAVVMQPWQEKYLRAFIAGAKPQAVATSVRLETDADGAMRRWPARDIEAPLMGPALAGVPSQYRGMIVYRQPHLKDAEVFNKLAIELLADPATAPMLGPLLRDRIVLIGADLPNDDRLPVPSTAITGRTLAGTEVHAHMIAQALDGVWPQTLPWPVIWLVALLAVVAGGVTAVQDLRPAQVAGLLAVQVLALIALPVLLAGLRSVDTTGFPALGLLLGWLIAFVAVGAAARSINSEQKRFAQGALGRYLPRDVAELILREPERLALSGEHREIYALFTDMEGFTKLSHRLQPEEVATFLNDYLDRLCAIVLRHGGTIDKFVGDAVVAFWGAPIARPDDGARALAAAAEMAGHCTLKVADPALTKGRTRVGLHWGQAVVGNFGGSGRIQYTALGDTMNTAARLEGANKKLKTSALVSAEAAARVPKAAVRPMGRVLLRGRATAIEVFEPWPDEASACALRDLYMRFEAGDREALGGIAALARATPEDAALMNLVVRLADVGPGGAYNLE